MWRLIIIVMLVPCAVAWASVETQEQGGGDRQAIRATVHDFLQAWEGNDPQRFTAALHDDVMFAYPGGRLDKSALIALFKAYQREKRDIKIYVWEHFFVDGERFFTAYQFAATDAATGKRQAVGTGVSGRIKDGKIILFKEFYDNEVAQMQYAGALPLDEGRVAPWPASIWLRPETVD